MRPLLNPAWRVGLGIGVALLSGCSSLNPFAGSSPKMAELAPVKATVELVVDWDYAIGKAGDFVFYPAVTDNAVFVAAADGSLARLENGVQKWRVQTGKPLSAGVGSDGERVVVGTRKGEVLAFSAEDGAFLWQAQASSEVLAPPLVEDDLVIVRSGDNNLTAFDNAGQRKWFYQRPTPSLSLRGAAPMLSADVFVLTGFPGGKLVAISRQNGAPLWEGTVALPKGATELERVADVVAPPAVFGAIACAVAFQGRVTCFDFAQNGNLSWSRDLSSSVGLTLDNRSVYVMDDESALHALDLASGSSRWKMDKLLRRKLTAPQTLGAYLLTGDAAGYLHVIDKTDGALAGRLKTDGSPILVAPQRLPDGQILIQTQAGRLYGLTLR
ncbi:MAG: outer membrane protein assembly factor BamB [Zoogloeaceae bacterium]|jgi:outer membrane protein assembly factor BamB|nr:outer membrane protein assembly factor BamB [Zoogloeaceae bacterium]